MAQESETQHDAYDAIKQPWNTSPSTPPGVDSKFEAERVASSPDNIGNEENNREILGLRWVLVVTAVLSTTFLYALDNTIVANIRPSIILSLGHINKLPWMSVAYAVGEVGSNPFWYSNLTTNRILAQSDHGGNAGGKYIACSTPNGFIWHLS